jgi:hypothetical protein
MDVQYRCTDVQYGWHDQHFVLSNLDGKNKW